MNKEIIRRWVDALRSGDFKQGQYALTEILDDSSQHHCCLGVLCSLLVEDGLISATVTDSTRGKYLAYDGEGRTGMPSARVREMVLGNEASSWWVSTDGGTTTTLDVLNDNARYSFDQIADVIEANWLQDEVDA